MPKDRDLSPAVLLTHVDSPELSFHETGADYRWISGRRFTTGSAPNDLELLAALVANEWYGHSYAEPTPLSPTRGGEIHGPYRIEAISAQSFVAIERDLALEQIESWAKRYDGMPEEFLLKVRTLTAELIPADFAVFELPDLRSIAEHQWGGVVGMNGFHEYVAISADRNQLNLLVASDD
jgi:hypothetical protein